MRVRREPLTVSVVLVPSEDGAERRERFLRLVGEALADVVIAEARAEVAARLGVEASAIDREARQLDEDARAFLDEPISRAG